MVRARLPLSALLLALPGLALSITSFSILPLSSAPVQAADPEPPRDVVIRGSRTIPQTVERVLTDGALSTVGTVIFAFEASTFAPPPGRTEFTAFYGFHADAEAWVKALVAAASRPTHQHLFALTSQMADLIALNRPAAERSLTDALAFRWAKDEKAPPFLPAARWMADAVRDARKLTKSERCAIVYVADRVLPERVFEHAEDIEKERGWRRRLAEVGAYFDEEAVGRKLAELRTALFVVAPEAHFEDFTPVAELPLLPWAARPEIHSWPDFFSPDLPGLPEGPSGSTPGGGPGGLPGMGQGMTADELEQLIKALPAETPEEIRRTLREVLAQLRKQE